MLKKITVAVPKRTQHMCDFYEFERALPKETVALWTKAVQLWEGDNTQVNPFKTAFKGMYPTIGVLLGLIPNIHSHNPARGSIVAR